MNNLTFQDAIRIARGCTDYKGGYENENYEIFQMGIKTVINALTAAGRGIDSQTAALHQIGLDRSVCAGQSST